MNLQATTNTITKRDNDESYQSSLQKYQSLYLDSIQSQLSKNEIELTPYKKVCFYGAIETIDKVLKTQGLAPKDIDQSSLTAAFQYVVITELNPVAGEMFFEVRNAIVRKEATGDVWGKVLRYAPQGKGNDRLLKKYGANVKEVRQPWFVREGDTFSFPSHNGLEITPPQWTQRGLTGKVLFVVYPVIMNSGADEWLIADRESVANNLKAHIANNLLGKEHKEKRPAILAKIADKSLDEMLDDKELSYFISPSWLLSHSRESMIVRKMRNNAVRQMDLQYDNAFVGSVLSANVEDGEQYQVGNQYQTADILPVIDETPKTDDVILEDELVINEKPKETKPTNVNLTDALK
jgi:hypothetical protein